MVEKGKIKMFRLRPRYHLTLYSLLALIPGVALVKTGQYYALSEMTAIGIAFLVVAALIFIGIVLYCNFHSLKFNTKEIEVRGKRYPIESLTIDPMIGINNLTASGTLLEVRHEGKRLLVFKRAYAHFFDFKAVIEAKGFHLDYF